MTRHVDFRRPDPPRVRFLEDLVLALDRPGRPARWTKPKRTVAWREGDTLNHVVLVPWNGDRPEAPLITRISANYYSYQPTARTLARLGFALTDRPVWHPRLILELTVLDQQLVTFGRWLPRWIAGRLDPAVPIPPPPVECHNWHRDWLTTDYAWSAAAWDAQMAMRKKEEEARARREARRSGARTAVPDTAAASSRKEAKEVSQSRIHRDTQRGGG